MSFPSIAEPAIIKTQFIKKQFISKAGKTYLRESHLISHREFILTWPDMDADDLDLLETYIGNYLGSSFSWTHNYTNEVITVVYGENGFSYNMSERYVPGHYSVTLKLIEVSGFGTTTTTTTTTTTSTSTTTV